MKYICQVTIVLGFTLLGELAHLLLPLPIPAAIYGLVLLFLALMLGIVKLHQVDGVSRFLIGGMSVLFVSPGVGIAQVWHQISSSAVGIFLVALVSTVVVFLVSGLVTQAILKKEEKRNG